MTHIKNSDKLCQACKGTVISDALDKAELTRLREVNAELVDALQEISRRIRESNHNTPAYRYFARLCDAALAKHKKG